MLISSVGGHLHFNLNLWNDKKYLDFSPCGGYSNAFEAFKEFKDGVQSENGLKIKRWGEDKKIGGCDLEGIENIGITLEIDHEKIDNSGKIVISGRY